MSEEKKNPQSNKQPLVAPKCVVNELSLFCFIIIFFFLDEVSYSLDWFKLSVVMDDGKHWLLLPPLPQLLGLWGYATTSNFIWCQGQNTGFVHARQAPYQPSHCSSPAWNFLIALTPNTHKGGGILGQRELPMKAPLRQDAFTEAASRPCEQTLMLTQGPSLTHPKKETEG